MHILMQQEAGEPAGAPPPERKPEQSEANPAPTDPTKALEAVVADKTKLEAELADAKAKLETAGEGVSQLDALKQAAADKDYDKLLELGVDADDLLQALLNKTGDGPTPVEKMQAQIDELKGQLEERKQAEAKTRAEQANQKNLDTCAAFVKDNAGFEFTHLLGRSAAINEAHLRATADKKEFKAVEFAQQLEKETRDNVKNNLEALKDNKDFVAMMESLGFRKRAADPSGSETDEEAHREAIKLIDMPRREEQQRFTPRKSEESEEEAHEAALLEFRKAQSGAS